MKALIVGSPRSGTSVVSNLLSVATGKKILDDPKYTWYLTPYIRIKRKVFSWQLIKDINSYSIIKMPGFAIILFYLKKISIKRFKVIYIVRDPRDNVCSVMERLKNGINGLYLNINHLGGEYDTFEETIAYSWNEYLKSAIAYQNKYPVDVLFVKYEDFMNDKIETIKRIADFSRLKADTSKIENLVDKQYRKDWSEKIGGEKRFVKELNSEQIHIIENICADNMVKFDYDLSTK